MKNPSFQQTSQPTSKNTHLMIITYWCQAVHKAVTSLSNWHLMNNSKQTSDVDFAIVHRDDSMFTGHCVTAISTSVTVVCLRDVDRDLAWDVIGVAKESGALNTQNSALVGLFPVAGENVLCWTGTEIKPRWIVTTPLIFTMLWKGLVHVVQIVGDCSSQR